MFTILTLVGTFFTGLFSKGGNAIGQIGEVVKSVWGNRESRDEYAYKENMRVQDSYAAEFLAPEKKHWFNMLIDGINRLVRPLFTYGIMAMFIWAAMDPKNFYDYVKNIQIIPESMWWVMLTIIGFWFGGRLFERGRMPSSRIDPKLASEIFNHRADMEAEERYDEYTEGYPVRPIVDSDEFHAANQVTKGMTNQAIQDWRRKKGK